MKRSAGLLLYRTVNRKLEVFLVHPGGPFYRRKEDAAWSLPKGEYSEGEDPLAAAKREFKEETGSVAAGDFQPLGEVRQAGGKIVIAWALEKDLDPTLIESNTFFMEWPPKSGKMQSFPEIDRAAWFPIEEARVKLLHSQLPFLERLPRMLSSTSETVR